MSGLLRSARFPAIVLLVAATLGIVLANSPLQTALADARSVRIAVGNIDLSVAHWISDGLLAVFFFTAAIELRHELTVGQLRSPRRALVPAMAAAGGVLAPIAVYLGFAGAGETAGGWPIPTATDIAFALGVLAVFGRGLPAAVRAFLLALAILDDIMGIVFIAVLFTTDLRLLPLSLAVALVALFALLSRVRIPPGAALARTLRFVALCTIGVATWAAVLHSGVHATIAGVALGFALAPRLGDRARHALEPSVNALVLPLFAFSAAAVTLPAVGGALSPAFWGVLVALPVGKIIGITAAGWTAQRLFARAAPGRHRSDPGEVGGRPLLLGDLIAAGALGGIGFTVSLLLGELAFGATDLGAQVTLAVLGGSIISLLLAAVLVSLRARHHRRAARAAAVA